MSASGNLRERFRQLGQANGSPFSLTIEELVRASEPAATPRLWLPPIQRSLVWDNQRIIHFWDSLFRKYPIGTMLAHPPSDRMLGVGDHRLDEPGEGDLALFDGQQRLHALRLGFGLVKDPPRKLWIDLGKVKHWTAQNDVDRELCLPLRISGPGQPFGYDADKPNAKYGADKQRQMLARDRAEAWKSGTHAELIDAAAPVQLAWFFTENGTQQLGAIRDFSDEIATVRHFTDELRRAPLLLVPVPAKIVGEPRDYQRFFERIGRGGVSLSDKELAYSIIKQHLPHIRAQMEGIKGVGRIADEIDLVLGCFRIARTLAGGDERDTWRQTNFPRAEDLRGFDPRAKDDATTLFMRFLPLGDDVGLLKDLFETLRQDLCAGDQGLPPMLLPHISGELWHVLLLLNYIERVSSEAKGGGTHRLSTFALWWLLFVENEQKAAREIFAAARTRKQLGFSRLIHEITEKGAARLVLSPAALATVTQPIVEDAELLAWNKRFGEQTHLQHWADDRRVRHRALMWLHRRDLASWNETKGFDPASDNQDDLPIEFDHLIPQSKWSYHWSDNKVADDGLLAFKSGRWHCGNGLGNFRILTSSANAARQDKPLDAAYLEAAGFDAPEKWLRLSGRSSSDRWSSTDIRDFQFIVQRRTLALYARLVEESGIAVLLGQGHESLASPLAAAGSELQPAPGLQAPIPATNNVAGYLEMQHGAHTRSA